MCMHDICTYMYSTDCFANTCRVRRLLTGWVQAEKRNSDGDVVRKGDPSKFGPDGGFTGLNPRDIWYCGKMKGECQCGACDGHCGPDAGCPCRSCAQLLITEGKLVCSTQLLAYSVSAHFDHSI